MTTPSAMIRISITDAVLLATSVNTLIQKRRKELQLEWQKTLDSHLVSEGMLWWKTTRRMTEKEKSIQDAYAREGRINYYGDSGYGLHDRVTVWGIVADFKIRKYNQCYHYGRWALQQAEHILSCKDVVQFIDFPLENWAKLKMWEELNKK